MKKIKEISDLANLDNGDFIEIEMRDKKRGIHSWILWVFLNKIGDNGFKIISLIATTESYMGNIGIVRYDYNEKMQSFESEVIEIIKTDSDKYEEYYARLRELASEAYKKFYARLKESKKEK